MPERGAAPWGTGGQAPSRAALGEGVCALGNPGPGRPGLETTAALPAAVRWDSGRHVPVSVTMRPSGHLSPSCRHDPWVAAACVSALQRDAGDLVSRPAGGRGVSAPALWGPRGHPAQHLDACGARVGVFRLVVVQLVPGFPSEDGVWSLAVCSVRSWDADIPQPPVLAPWSEALGVEL